MKAKSARHACISSFLVIAAVISLTGCQLLGNQQNPVNDSVVLSDTSLDFGTVAVGNSKAMPNKLTNFKTTSVTIVSIAGLDNDFQINGVTLPLVLTSGQEVQFSVNFKPSKQGKATKTIQFGDNQAFLAAMNVAGDAVAPGQLALNPSSVSFGNVKVGNNKSTNVTLSNTGDTDLTIDQATLSGAQFSMSSLALPLTLHAGGTASFSVTFAPTAAGNFTGNVSFSTSAASQAKVNGQGKGKGHTAAAADTVVLALSGAGVTAGALSPNPANLAFGNVPIGSNSSKSETLTNTGGSSLTISQANATGAGFSISGLTLPTTLAPNQTVSFTAKFAPASAGAANGNLTLTSDGSNPTLTIPLSGTGVAGTLSASPVSLSFGSVQVGNNTSLPETLTNTGSANVTISQANATGAGFSITGLTLPATLTPGQTVTFSVKFAPTSAGNATGNVAVVSNASNSPLNIALTGIGLAPGSLTANPSSVSFGNVIIGNTPTRAVTVTNSGGASVTISNAAATGNGFSFTGPSLPTTLNAGQSTTFNVTFGPSGAGNSSGNLTMTSNASNPTLAVPLSGTGVTQGQIAPNPVSLGFGSVAIGSNKSLTETLTNSGGTSLTISAAAASGTGFSITGLTLPLTLTAGQSTTFTVKFAPTAAGAASGNVNITSNGANPSLDIPLSGTGVTPGTLSANPTSLAFGNVQTGSNSSLPETLTNTGGSNVTISQANVTGAGFSVTGLSLPATLTPNQTVTFSVKFAPSAAGAVSGNVAIVSDASNSPLNISLSGTGVAPGQLTPNPTSLSFGNVQVGNTKTLTETLTNSGGSSLTISAASSTGSAYSISGLTLPLTLAAGQSTTFDVQFAPTAGGAANGNVRITSDASNPTLNIALTGTGVTPGTLSANPPSLGFGNVQIGTTANLSETLTNTGGTTVTISNANVTGTGFSITGLTVPSTLTAGQSVTFTAKFSPTVTGAASGNLAITSDAPNSPLNIALTGSGTPLGQLSVSPATLNFGNVVVGANSALPGTLTATGASVTVTSGTSDSSEFVLSGITFPKTIAAGASANFTVTFTPNATGAATGSITFQSNASNAPTIQSLTGNGQAPPQHSVDLTWNASPTSGVVGYNIYRRTSSSGYAKINSSLNTSLAYTDNNVTANQIYFYEAKAVDGNDVESGPSNEVQVQIPTP